MQSGHCTLCNVQQVEDLTLFMWMDCWWSLVDPEYSYHKDHCHTRSLPSVTHDATSHDRSNPGATIPGLIFQKKKKEEKEEKVKKQRLLIDLFA